MAKLKIDGRYLRSIGYPEGPVIPVAMKVIGKEYKFATAEEAEAVLKNVLADPEAFKNDNVLGAIAAKLIVEKDVAVKEIPLNTEAVPYRIFGRDQIEDGALKQLETAARLPVAVAAALMPDAHAGYGLPIGGVLATENAVIPYAVGVDIGCRMCLSLFDIAPSDLTDRESFFSRELIGATKFGSGKQFDEMADHEVLDNPAFRQIDLLKRLQGKAALQLGTSGSGNHFVELGIVEVPEAMNGLEKGRYVGLLSHSGSRGFGANIANHYTQIARAKRPLPGDASNLAWLGLDEEAGIEYWIAMNLAGDYASACHHVIHDKISKALGREPLARVENHHNFAWKEVHEGREVIVHRKGATPAAKGVLGIIPGSMTAPGFIVKGKGEPSSLDSAAHGAGRRMSRSAALKSITKDHLKDTLDKFKVKLLGAGLDEAPQAYKDIEQVMQSQRSLVDVVGTFYPKIVRMDGTPPKKWRDKGKSDAFVEGE